MGVTAAAPLSNDELAAAVMTSAHAMRDNPLHCAVFGFVTVATASVVGVPSWFMLRAPTAPRDTGPIAAGG